MVDVHNPEQRSYNMSRIRRSHTKPELKFKDFLEKKGFVFQEKTYGNPDFMNFRKRIVIFIDGCFWHKCPKCFKMPSSNKKFWKEKIENNVRRDKEIYENYKYSGWMVVRIWEHQIKKWSIFINDKSFDKIWKIM